MNGGNIILLFVKDPIRGRVKTRLAESLGEGAALDLYRNFVLDSVNLLAGMHYPFRICFYPPAAGESISRWLGASFHYQSQSGEDLGERMLHAFRTVFAEGFERVTLVGSDVPDIPGQIFEQALDSLRTNDAVLGPSDDGGYYLIGFTKKSFLPKTFHGINWSTGSVFSETLSILEAASLSVRLLPRWRDVDSPDDLKSLFERNRDTEFRTSKTMNYLEENRKVLLLR